MSGQAARRIVSRSSAVPCCQDGFNLRYNCHNVLISADINLLHFLFSFAAIAIYSTHFHAYLSQWYISYVLCLVDSVCRALISYSRLRCITWRGGELSVINELGVILLQTKSEYSLEWIIIIARMTNRTFDTNGLT